MKKTSFVSKILSLTVLAVWLFNASVYAQKPGTDKLNASWATVNTMTTRIIASADDGAVVSITKGTADLYICIPRDGVTNPDPKNDADWVEKQTITVASTDGNAQVVCYKGSAGLRIKAVSANPNDVKVEFKPVCGVQ